MRYIDVQRVAWWMYQHGYYSLADYAKFLDANKCLPF